MRQRPDVLWRLEIHGRPGWFTPAAQAFFTEAATAEDVRHRLFPLIRSYYGAEEGDRITVFRVEPANTGSQEPARPAPKATRGLAKRR